MKKKTTNPLAEAEYNSGFGAFGLSLIGDIYSENTTGQNLRKKPEGDQTMYHYDLPLGEHYKHKKEGSSILDNGIFDFGDM